MAFRALRPLLGLLICALNGACTGEIGGSTRGEDTTPGGGDGTLGMGEPPLTPGSVDDCKGFALDPGPTELRRLTNREYANSVARALGIDAADLVSTFPDDVLSGGFDNAASAQSFSLVHGERYFDAAEKIAERLVADATLRDAALGCNPADGQSCLASIVDSVGLRLFRRPLTDEQKSEYLALTAIETDPNAAASIVIEATLNSPYFLFRPEVGAQSDERGDLEKLTGYELATRLSYFLTAGPPDGPLLQAAADGTLDSREGVEQAARQLLQDPTVQSGMQAFTEQWLRLAQLDKASRSAERFPEFGLELVSSMRGEMQRLFDEYLWTPGANLLDIFTARHSYVDANIAALYGVAAPASDFARVDFADGDVDRGGLFTMPGFLTASTRGDSTSPIQRGKYVREVIMCDPPPAPPANVPQLMPAPDEPTSDAEERHTADPACSGCHSLINPIGYGLERYDSIGKLRDVYLTGQAVRQTGHVEGIENSDFGGGVELGQVLATSEQAPRCVVVHLFRWALGRSETSEGANDACTVLTLADTFGQSNHQFAELAVALVTSDAFRFRRPVTD